MVNLKSFASLVAERTPAYAEFLRKHGFSGDISWEHLPLTTKENYLLSYPLPDLCWDGSLQGCHLIGASSGFSGGGSVYWPKRPGDERDYLAQVEQVMIERHGIDQRPTLIFICLAFGTWIGGMQLAAVMRSIAATGRHPLTVATPGLNLAEAVQIYQRYGAHYEQTIWVTNPSNVPLITSLLDDLEEKPEPGSMFFPVVGEYFTEAFRENLAQRFGHVPSEPYCLWTGYGSADTGDLGMESAATIELRKFFHRRPALSEQFFGPGQTPMLLVPTPKAHLEIVDGNLVVTKDQLVPLVRYDTGDACGLLNREDLENLPLETSLQEQLPEMVLFVRGRASDAIVFYGTNLSMGDVADFFLELPASFCYGGLFKVKPDQVDGFTVFTFVIPVRVNPDAALRKQYRAALIDYLKGQSLEFKTKYEALTGSVSRPLIEVELTNMEHDQGAIKHKFIVEG